ncbi:hypothetical protein [Pelagovum sp. HNIBRBA483]|uniref:hypothetical protein n=1 Tax=Pelagovum sp. HNIBRBA483 TaxID=3233341 RepID=UPI0034A5CEB0
MRRYAILVLVLAGLAGCADWPKTLALPDDMTPSGAVSGTELTSIDYILAGADGMSADGAAIANATSAEGADLRARADALRARQP